MYFIVGVIIIIIYLFLWGGGGGFGRMLAKIGNIFTFNNQYFVNEFEK